MPNRKLAIYHRISNTCLVDEGSSINFSRAAYNQFNEKAFDIVRDIVVIQSCRSGLCLRRGIERIKADKLREDEQWGEQTSYFQCLFDLTSSKLLREESIK